MKVRVEKSREDGTGPGNAIPKPFFHDLKLGLQNLFLTGFKCFSFGMVNEEAYDIEESTKPSDHENDVECLKIFVHAGIMQIMKRKSIYFAMGKPIEFRRAMPGQRDIPLNEKGCEQAKELIEVFKDIEVDAIFQVIYESARDCANRERV